nr:hypothetical transcript [Hymenolepis microstoma]
MDMPYRTFPPSNQSNSTRKRVNVTFRSNPSPVVESGKPSSRRSSTVSNPSSTSSGNRTNSALKSSASTHIIAPKFKRQRGTQRKTNANQRGTRPGSSQSQTKTTPSPPPLSTSENSDLDPYAFVEDEEITRKEEEKEELAPKLSEFAFTEEEEEDDGIKPWFWTPAREAPKQTQPASQVAQPQISLTSPNLKGGEIRTNGTTPIKVDNDAKNVLTDKSRHDTQVQNSLQQALSELGYLTSGMNDANSVDARCHKILTLAQKCLSPAKRDLIHAYKLLNGICTKLQDAPNNYCLGLATSGLFFIISRDRDPEFLTPDSLDLLLRLLHAPNSMTENSAASATSNSDSKYTVSAASRQSRLNKEAANMRSRVQELLESVAVLQQKRRNRNASPAKSSSIEPPPAALTSGMAALFAPRKAPSSVASLFSGSISNPAASALVTRHLRMNRQLTAHDLVLEAILNLATRRAAPWFKTGMRTGGGLDGIADATIDAMDYLKDLCIFDSGGSSRSFSSFANVKNPTALDDFSLDNLKKVGHYTRALENMTYKDTDNQTHLVRYRDRILIDRLVQCMRLCASRLPRNPPPSISWTELLKRIAKEEEEAFTDHRSNQQPPTSSTNEGISSDGDSEDKTSKDNSAAASVEFQQDQQILLNCLISIFRLLVNVSQSEYAADRLGGCPDFLESTLDCLFHLPHSLPASRRLDLTILVLCLLANICEHCPDNRIRIVHLEIKSPESSTGGDPNVCSNANPNMSLDDVGYEDDDEGERNGSPRFSLSSRVPTVSALDEVVKLFLFREKSSLLHEFERDEGREEKTEEADSTTNMTTTATTTMSGFQRPKPPPSILAAAADEEPETIEEAGLKWRLVGTNKHEKGLALSGADSRSPRTKRLRMRAKRRKRRLALLKRVGGDKDTKRPKLESGEYSSEEDEEDEEEEIEEDEDEMCSDEDDASEGSDNEDFDEDDEMCGGADVEFVAETQEEKDKLQERMSSANQHMEDSVVAAYAALVLGCILQSSPRYAERIRSRLPEPGKFRPLAIMLAKLASFLSITRGAEVDGYGSIMRIVRILEAQDQPQQPSTSTNSSPTRSLRSITPPVTRSARSRFEI